MIIGILYQCQCELYNLGERHGLCVAKYKDCVIAVTRYNHGAVSSHMVCVDWESGGIIWNEKVYLYPDMETALVGDFTGGQMKSAHLATNVIISVNDDGFLDLSWSEVTGPEFRFSPSKPDNFGDSDPMLKDPYETKCISVRTSCMESGGQGVFANVDLPPNTLAAVFNGYRVPIYGGKPS